MFGSWRVPFSSPYFSLPIILVQVYLGFFRLKNFILEHGRPFFFLFGKVKAVFSILEYNQWFATYCKLYGHQLNVNLLLFKLFFFFPRSFWLFGAAKFTILWYSIFKECTKLLIWSHLRFCHLWWNYVWYFSG